MRLPLSLAIRSLTLLGILAAAVPSADAQFKTATPEQIDKDIKAIVAGGNGRTLALKRLGEYDGPLEEKQKEVAGMLMKLVESDKDYNACRSLAVWATESQLKDLVEYLDAGDDIAKAAVYVYSKKKHAPASKMLALRLEDGAKDYKMLVNALINQGTEAEEFVIPYLSDEKKKKNQCKFAIEIIMKIGTKKSLKALSNVANSEDNNDNKKMAKIAITKIEEREKSEKVK